MAMPPIRGLHHYAYRCRDAEETRAFYEDLLGLPLVHVITSERAPSTGEHCPYCHVFFRMRDGSCLAFFDLGDGRPAEADLETPSWVNHLALEVADEAELLAAKLRLEAAGVEVVGPTDHHIIKSIYFFDPNGVRLELTCRATNETELEAAKAEAHAKLAEWRRQHGVAA